jgi:hypothetical protein
MRRVAGAALGAITALTLAGCVTIPSSGSVLVGREVSDQGLQGRTEFLLEGPVEGADQEAILTGFIAAYSGTGNYDVARQFLAEGFDEEWDPRESVLVRTGSWHIDRVGETAMEYSIVNNAIVDRDGVYTSFAPTPHTLGYEFVLEDGEWRISAAPDGIVLSSGTFEEFFKVHAIYYLDPTGRFLVPDLRWYPSGTAAGRIVSAILNGPPSWLEGAVTTAFPEGTQLAPPKRVTVESGIAQIDLSAEALAASDGQRQLMRAQLEGSLRSLSIPSVELSVEGTPLTIPPLGPSAPQLRPQISNQLLVLRDDEFGFLAGDRITPIDGLSNKIVSTEPRAVTLGADGISAAVLGRDGVYLVRSAVEEPTLIDGRNGLIAPDLDPHGYLWSAQRAGASSIRVFDTNGNVFPIQTTLPADAQIAAISVSRDGARIAILLRTESGPRVQVGAIIRDQNRDQVPLSIGDARIDAAAGSGDPVDVTWMDELTVATLTGSDDDFSVTSFQVGGKSRSLGSPGVATAIIGGTSENGLRVLRADGVVAIKRPSGWQAGPEVSLIAMQR